MIHVALVVLRMDPGGAERCIARIANHLDRSQFCVSIICVDRSGPACEWITRDDVGIVELGLKHGNNWAAVVRLTEALKRLQPDIVHSHNWATLVESYLAVRRYGSAIHLHGERGTVLGSDGCGPGKRKLRALAMRWISRRIALTTNSHRVAAKVSAITGIDSTNIHVVPNGLDSSYTPDSLLAFREQTRHQLGLSDETYLVGSVARLCKVKNLEMLIQAASQAKLPNGQLIHVLLVGDGPSRRDLEVLASDCEIIKQVHFVGHQQDAWRFLAAMDVFVNCSDSEGMSQSMLEAMAVGLPIVATDVGDAAIMLGPPDACGIVIEAGDCQGLSEAITDLTTQIQRQAYKARARDRQKARYSQSQMIHGYEQLYEALVTSEKAKH